MSDDLNLRDQFNILFDDFDDAEEAVQKAADTAENAAEAAGEAAADAAGNAAAAAGEAVDTAVENAGAVVDAAEEAVGEAAGQALDAAEDFGRAAEETAQNVSGETAGVLAGAAAAFAAASAGTEAKAEQAVSQAAELVDDTDIRKEELFRDIDFRDLSDVIAEGGEDEPAAVTNAVKQAAETAKEAGDELDERFSDDLTSVDDDFAFDDDFDSLTKTLEEFDEDLDGDGEAGNKAEADEADADSDLEFEDISGDGDDGEDTDGDGEADEFEEDDDEYEDEDDAFPVRKRVVRSSEPTAEDLKKESRNFWIFTGIVALLVAAAVLFILWRRGIIFDQPTTTEVPTTLAPSTTEPATTAEPTTEEPTTEEPTTEEPTTEEPTTEEPSTEPDASEVIGHYSNMFVVKADEADSLYVRNAPAPDAMVIGILYGYAGGEITGEEGDWYAVFTGSITGYVSKAYVVTGNEAAVLAKQHASLHAKITAATVRVRSSADTSSEDNIINTVAQGACLPYIATEGEFFKVEDPSGREGYVSVHYSNLGYYLDEAVPYRLPNS